MGPSTLRLALLGAMAPALARAASTTSDSSIINLFVIDPTPAVSSQTIHASIMRVVPSLTQTEYYITCVPLQGEEYFGKPKPAPCNHIDGASVTINPTGMALHLVRTSIILDARELPTKETAISVSATATCAFSGSSTASCTGAMTSSALTQIYIGNNGTRTEQSAVETETISSVFSSMGAHTGFEKLQTSTSTTVQSTSSTGGAGEGDGRGSWRLLG
ncbi:hypothetical protein NEMBOFW57_009629 [Staphylotrichum longicolle]|uniref:Uncharacterized protein n=1 Tax=Staphylotrichum longicolle TaxID=669026 RepID=A0AAD4EPC9_9PEZI|nr:hypothetical protein NEMBOFW57_009629 [Staphylotrichum longicolle]